MYQSEYQIKFSQKGCPGLEWIIFVVAFNTYIMYPTGRFIFSQIVDFLPKRQFNRIVSKYTDCIEGWSLSPWNQLLIIMYGQLDGSRSLRELGDVIKAHSSKSKHLGFGDNAPSLIMISRANQLRDYHIFEDFAYYMVDKARAVCTDSDSSLKGRGTFYAFDSTTIDLCLRLYEWAKFRSTKSGIKIHTQIDVVSLIPVLFYVTNANVHDVNAMDMIEYEANACYIFDKGYWDLKRLFKIETVNSFFVIREKKKPEYSVECSDEAPNESLGVLADQTVRFTGQRNQENYPATIRRIVYYAEELHRSFVYYTNNFYLKAQEIAFLYKNRWVVELFFKWIKQHLRVTTFWGNSENAVRIQVYVAISTYCLVCIMRQQMQLKQNPYDILRILGSSLLTKDHIVNLFSDNSAEDKSDDSGQLRLDFGI